MLNEELFDALKQIKKNDKGSLCIIKPISDEQTDRDNFDHLVLCAFRLRELGYIDFTDKQVRKDFRRSGSRYSGLICQFKYQGTQILEFESFNSYEKSDLYTSNSKSTLIDQSVNIKGDIIGSNFSAHSKKSNQSIASNDIEKLIKGIINALEEDNSISKTEQKELIEDANILNTELKRSKPRSQIIGSIYNTLSNTASIASLVIQLAPSITSLMK